MKKNIKNINSGNKEMAKQVQQDEKLDKILLSFMGKEHEIIPILQKVQYEYGYLPEPVLFKIAEFTGVPESQVYSVATFYAQFRFTPRGKKHIMVCRGTACHVRGAPRILEEVQKRLGIKEGETSPDLEYSLETVACIGQCGLAPNMVINDITYGRLTKKKIFDLFCKGKKEEVTHYEENPK
ncbi:MAG: NADH-quinone oxidoreductase subunit NuoE [Spirochaetota bacterium]